MFNTSRDLIDALADLWPGCFSVYEARRRPLKLGIRQDIIATGAVTEDEAAAALRFYCSNRGYLRACREGEARVGLDGTPAGVVTASEAANSLASLRAREAKRAAKTNGANPNRAAPVASTAPPTSPSEPTSARPPTSPKANGKPPAAKAVPAKPAAPERLGLADLREAWRERQRQAGVQP